jgi:hypothetical protein
LDLFKKRGNATVTVRISSFVEISTNGKYTPYADKMQEKFASLAKFVSLNWDLAYRVHLGSPSGGAVKNL